MDIRTKIATFGGWTLFECSRHDYGAYYLLENVRGFVDYPIRYANGHIAYDRPEEIPQNVQNTVRFLLPVKLI